MSENFVTAALLRGKFRAKQKALLPFVYKGSRAFLFGWGLAHVRASTATTISLAETVLAASLAVVIGGERLPALAWVGAGLVAGRLFVLTLPSPRQRHRSAEENPPNSSQPSPAVPTRA